MIAGALNFAYATKIPCDPVVVIVLRLSPCRGEK